MRLVEERFRSHLLADESVEALTFGRLLEAVVRGRAAIGLTDRRLLCVSKTGEFVDVRYDYICSIRSRQQTRVQYQPTGEANRFGHLAIGFLAMAALAAVVFSVSSASVFQEVVTTALVAVTVAVAVAVEGVRKRPGVDRAHESIFVGAGALVLLGLVGIGLLSASVHAPLYVLGTLGALVLIGYAARHGTNLAGLPLHRHRETLLDIHTADGETIHLAVDTDSALTRELSACVYQGESEPVESPAIRSPTD